MNHKRKSKTARITTIGVVGALYVVVTYILQPVSFGPVQFRAAEALLQMVPYSPWYIVAFAVGTALSNLTSPLGMIDVAVGTLATVLGLGIPYLLTRKAGLLARHIGAGIGMTLSMALVAWELTAVFGLPYLPTFLTCAAGEAATQLVGYVLVKGISTKMDLTLGD
jgi:uncharacterized membrane protein